MNIPFPLLTPRLVDPKWFNADSPCDEEAEIAALEQENRLWLNSISQQYMKRAPLGKTNPEPMEEEADSDEEDGKEMMNQMNLKSLMMKTKRKMYPHHTHQQGTIMNRNLIAWMT